MSVKRILLYCDEYPPARSGGIGSVTKIVAEALAARNFHVVVAGSYESGSCMMGYSLVNGVHVYRFPYFRFLRFFPVSSHRLVKAVFRRTGGLSRKAAMDLAQNENKIAELIHSQKIEVVELIDFIALLKEIKQPVLLRKFDVPATLRIHGSVSFLNINKGIVEPVQLENDRRNFERADQLSSVSSYSKDFVNTQILKNPRIIEVIYNPIEEQLLNHSAKSSIGNTILFYGKITDTKGAFQVLKAFQAVVAEFPDWKLNMLGGGELERAERMITAENAERICLTGYVSRDQVISAIEEAAFVVIPSYFENFSMAPLEVMAKGKALIYTKRTSGPEIIDDGVNGLLVEPDNLTELQEKMIRLMTDSDFRNKLAAAGFETVKNKFTLSTSLDQLQKHYDSLKHG